MVDWYGRWTYCPEVTDKKQWCDLDYVAHWMFDEMKYQPSMDLYAFLQRLIHDYENELTWNSILDKYYYAIPDPRIYPENLMIYVPDVAVWVYDNGGLRALEMEYAVS